METDEETLREVWRRWNAGRRDLNEELFDPDIEVHSRLANRVYRGPEQAREWMREIDDQFDDWNVSIEQVTPVGSHAMLVAGTIHGRGRQSGIDLDESAAWIVAFRNGRVLSIRNFIGQDALEQARSEADDS